MIEHINSGNEAAGIINQGNDIDPVFFAIRICKAGTDAAVPAPDLIDMRAFIAAHILVRCLPQFRLKPFHKAADCGFGYLSVYYRAIGFQLPVNSGRRHAWIVGLEIPDSLLEFFVKLAAHAGI